MAIGLIIVLLLAAFFHHLFVWKPLDTSILYANHPYLKFGHRGTPVYEPENTIPSFQRAISDGCNAIELDVYRTTDGHLIVFHDDTLERTTDGVGSVADKTLEELQAVNAAHLWPGRQEMIPTLESVVKALPDDTVFNFEIKNFSFFSEQRTELELVRFIHEHQLRDRVILSSFNPLNIWRVKMADPSIFTAYLWFNPSVFTFRHPLGVHLCHPDIFHPFTEDVNWGVQFWSRIKRIPMHVWVVNNEEEMRQFAKDPNIKGMMSDDSKMLVETLMECGI
jgi:glycerophosphoryl diester phosphodiesterase